MAGRVVLRLVWPMLVMAGRVVLRLVWPMRVMLVMCLVVESSRLFVMFPSQNKPLERVSDSVVIVSKHRAPSASIRSFLQLALLGPKPLSYYNNTKYYNIIIL